MRNIIFAVAVACMAAGCATKQVERTSVRFLHWSVSHFSDGTYSVASIPESEGEKMAAKYVKFLDSVDADIVGITEYNENFTTNGSMKASTALFKGYEKSVGPAKGDVCNAIFYKSAKASKIEEKDVFFERHFEDTYYRAVNRTSSLPAISAWACVSPASRAFRLPRNTRCLKMPGLSWSTCLAPARIQSRAPSSRLTTYCSRAWVFPRSGSSRLIA